jgi:hypothetical protein
MNSLNFNQQNLKIFFKLAVKELAYLAQFCEANKVSSLTANLKNQKLQKMN